MAVFLQKTNQPVTTPASWGGCFTCCFSKPNADADDGLRNENPPPASSAVNEAPKTAVPTANGERMQPPEIKLTPGSGPTTPAPSRTPSVNSMAPIETMDKTNASSAQEGQANKAGASNTPSLTGSRTGLNYGLTNPHAIRQRLPSGNSDKPAPGEIQTMYEQWGGNQATSKANTGSPAHSLVTGGSAVGTEFAEEPYNQNLQWEESPNFGKGSTISLASRPGIVTKIKFDFKESVLYVHFGEVSKAPTKAEGGASAYQVRIAILMKRKKRWHSKVHEAPNPTINETAVFKDMNLDELHKTGLRIRLYSIEKMHRHKIFGETVVPFTSLNLRTETTYPITLEYRSHRLGVESDSDVSDSLSRLTGISHRMGSRLSLHSRRSSTGSRSVDPVAQQNVAENVAKSKNANWPELLIGLSYTQQTGRLNITAVKASKLKISDAPSAVPKTYISVSLMTKTGQKITAAKTKSAHSSRNPEYGEKFSFEVPAVQINDVVLFFRVFHKHTVHKDENIGWFAIGCSNSGSEEEAHWRDMLAAGGQEIMRWHTLNEDVR
uniref:Synaptotagmin-14 n=1 Tax=Schistocephalus solidus TaxID=70667 RepID=A0A0X3NMA6_SCHSO